MNRILLGILGFAIGMLLHAVLIGLITFIGTLLSVNIIGAYLGSGLNIPVALILYVGSIYYMVTRD